MGWGNIKESIEAAVKDTLASDEFKEVVKKAVIEVVDEGSQLIDKIVPESDKQDETKKLS